MDRCVDTDNEFDAQAVLSQDFQEVQGLALKTPRKDPLSYPTTDGAGEFFRNLVHHLSTERDRHFRICSNVVRPKEILVLKTILSESDKVRKQLSDFVASRFKKRIKIP